MTQSIQKSPRSVLAVLCVLALVLTGLGTQSATADESPDVLNASSVALGVIDSDIQVGRYTVTAQSDRAVEVDAQNRTGGDMTFTQRLKLNGGGALDYRSVVFTTHGEAVLHAYALSASAGADRLLALYDEEEAVGIMISDVRA